MEFIREMSTPDSPHRSVQLVKSARDGDRVRQRILRQIGVAMDDDEFERLQQLREYLKAKSIDERQPTLFALENLARMVVGARRQGDGRRELRVNLAQLLEEQRVATGVHVWYGESYRQLGIDRLLPHLRYRASHDTLFQMVMAWIVNPVNKRGSVPRFL